MLLSTCWRLCPESRPSIMQHRRQLHFLEIRRYSTLVSTAFMCMRFIIRLLQGDKGTAAATLQRVSKRVEI